RREERGEESAAASDVYKGQTSGAALRGSMGSNLSSPRPTFKGGFGASPVDTGSAISINIFCSGSIDIIEAAPVAKDLYDIYHRRDPRAPFLHCRFREIEV
ncbi:hypothetical protein, partial [Staphylococcus pseudintermedius]|uniref:hypothetical protein n=1 Tax=Staphylococcus pseudintermedius TaxID=283734 RepID=UPI0019D41F11